MSLVEHEKPINLSDDWLTPRYFLDALGVFDLDPCASTGPGQQITASKMIRLPEDGLSSDWHGRVWLNPPYSRFAISGWLRKLSEHGNGIALVFARSDSKWFQEYVLKKSDAILWMRGRVKFLKPNGDVAENSAGAPSILAAYGPKNVSSLLLCGIPGHITLKSLEIGK